jgi:hypothetical protein
MFGHLRQLPGRLAIVHRIYDALTFGSGSLRKWKRSAYPPPLIVSTVPVV